MNYSFLIRTPLFHGLSQEEAEDALNCLGAYEKRYDKDEVILHAGETTENLGIVLSGSINIENHDIWGNKSILSYVPAGQIFAETYACIPDQPLMVDVVACEKSSVLFVNAAYLLSVLSHSCVHYNKLIQNLLQISAEKNLTLSRRILHTSPKTIRNRLLSYLSEQAQLYGSCSFIIPFDRQQLADYLSVDRSALSNELSKMQKDGILRCHKNTFTLFQR